MSKFPYFKIVQFNKEFLVTKMNADFLLEHVDFEFRFPYKNSEKDIVNAKNYINNLKKKLNQTIQVTDKENGIQRRTDLNRIESIADYINSGTKGAALFPTPLVLGINLYEGEDNSIKYNPDSNELEFADNKSKFTIIDGQHRLLGIARYAQKYSEKVNELELPVVLFPDIDLQDATKLFIDINANQKKVNKSLVFDLYENIDEPMYDKVKNIKGVVKALNDNTSSVLNNKIKMLGTGEGTVSLAFMIDYIDSEILKNIEKFDQKELLISLNNYFSAFEGALPNKWEKLLKTTGMGAMLMYYPKAQLEFGKFTDKYATDRLLEHLMDLEAVGQIDLNQIVGSGKQAQKRLLSQFETNLLK